MATKLFTTKQAAKYLSISAAFLNRDRHEGARIPFVKVGTRSIRYRESDLDRFLDSQVRYNTVDSKQAQRRKKR